MWLRQISIEVANFKSHYVHERKVTLHLKELLFQTKESQPALDNLNPEVKQLNSCYNATSLKIGGLEIVESFYVKGAYVDVYLLKIKIIIYFYDCIYKNHPLFTDKKVHILIPYLNVHLDDNFILLFELVQSFVQSGWGSANKAKKKRIISEKIEMGENQSN